MFTSDHEIWKFADSGGELDDWLPYAEDLVKKWSSQGEDGVKFNSTWEIILASLLLMDDLLPPSARKAFAMLTLEAIDEATAKKVAIKCLRIKPPQPGRKEDIHFRARVILGVKELLKTGLSKTEAYEATAREVCKSPDTIRRIYERARKRSRSAKKFKINTGEIGQ